MASNDGFLNDFLEKDSKPRVDATTKNTVRHDKWDREDYDRLLAEMDELGASEDRLTDVVDTGSSMMADTYFSLVKSVPELRGQNEIRPSYLINLAVMEEATELKEHEELRMYSVNDEIQAGLACVTMEPELEIIYDKLKQEQKLAKEIEDQMQQMGGLQQEDRDLDEMINSAQEEGDGEGAQDFQQQQARIQEAMEQLQKAIDQNVGELQERLQNARPMIKDMMKGALDEATEQAEDMEAMTQTWGLDPGAFHRLPPKERLALAQRMNNDKFRRIAQLFGPMSRMAFAEQQRKTQFARDEVYEVETGSDLANVLPAELLYLDDEILELDFFRRYVEAGLLQYKLRGTEKVAKGGIIFNEDGSGSMGGDKEVWAKAVGLCLLHIAKSQNRSFYGIHFGGPGMIQEFDFRDPRSVDLEEVISFAELFFNGGPLRVDQRMATPDGWKPIGNAKIGDLVFGPDGQPTEIVGVYPQGELDLYNVTFRDGATVVCDGSHVWTVRNKLSGSSDYVNMTLSQMLESGLVYNHDHGARYNFSVPVTQPVELSVKDFPIHPYLLGYLLGDGTLGGDRSVIVHSSESEHPWRDFLPEDVSVTTYLEPSSARCGSYGLKGTSRGSSSKNSVIEGLAELELLGVRGEAKFVPEAYLWGSVDQRFDLLSGLLDSDGSTLTAGGFEFSNTSEALCEAVVHLAQSLGGVGSIHESSISSNEKPCWRVIGRVAASLGAPFRLTRKVAQYKQQANQYLRSIVSAERVESDQAICIKVDRDDGLFLTEGMVVTHNTDFMTPLSRSLDLMLEEYNAQSCVKGDIVFCTDGICGVDAKWLENFKNEQARLGFRVWGIVIGGSTESEPLHTICDGRVFTIKDLMSGGDVRDMFREV